MKVFGLRTLLATSVVWDALAFQNPQKNVVERHTSSAVMASPSNEDVFDRRSFFSSAAQKTAVASLILTSTPSSMNIANAADSFPKVYNPAAHSMDGKLGKTTFTVYCL